MALPTPPMLGYHIPLPDIGISSNHRRSQSNDTHRRRSWSPPTPMIGRHCRWYSASDTHSKPEGRTSAQQSQFRPNTPPEFSGYGWGSQSSASGTYDSETEGGFMGASPSVSPEVGIVHLPEETDYHAPHGGGIEKPRVTSTRTREASEQRRKKPAKYACPISGCKSTFTRRINLTGHIRAHKNERPFVCHWGGCGRRFARLHDCRRHEQLHAEEPSFGCDGCGKKFARLDALSRH
ncbi:hypothetical protein R3P38DRAFT_2911094, partial [Favolaschia claudopus]